MSCGQASGAGCPKSIFDALSIENDFECESVFTESGTRSAPRIHYRYLSNAERIALGVSPLDGIAFEKYALTGRSWLPESWVPLRADTE